MSNKKWYGPTDEEENLLSEEINVSLKTGRLNSFFFQLEAYVTSCFPEILMFYSVFIFIKN